MKSIITAVFLSMVSMAASAAWDSVDQARDGSYYIMSDMTEQYGEHVTVALYAMPDKGCDLALKFISLVPDSDLDPGSTYNGIPVSIEMKVDKIDKWIGDDQTMDIEVGDDGMATMSIGIFVERLILKEMSQGRVMKYRVDVGQDGNWTSTLRVSLKGSARRIGELMTSCAKHDEWGDAVWKSNQSENEWES